MRSPAELLATAAPDERARILQGRDLAALRADWGWWARPEQRGPELRTPDHLPSYAVADAAMAAELIAAVRVWFYCAGRGAGKTRALAEWMVDRAELGYQRGAIVGTTAAHCRDVQIEGESGLGAVCERRKIRAKYEPSKRRFTIRPSRHTKMVAATYSAEKPDLLAGPQHDTAWVDEPGSFAVVVDGAGRTSWDNLSLGMRLSSHPQIGVSGTPRARPLIKDLLNPKRSVHEGGDVLVTTATIFDNPFLPAAFFDWIVTRYAGTRLGEQELLGLLVELSGTLFKRQWWDEKRADGQDRWLTAADWADYSATAALTRVRYWDLAATEDTGDNDPDWTAGSLVAWDHAAQRFVWEDVRMTRSTPGGVEALVAETAQADPKGTVVYIEKDPAQAGKSQVEHYRDRVLGPLGVVCRPWPPTGDKVTRATLPSSEAEAGRLWIVRSEPRRGELAPWWQVGLAQLEEFPDSGHDDIVDSLSGAVAVLDKEHRMGVQATGPTASAQMPRVGRPPTRTG